jgi:filamentous hemagglutinin family protein
MRKSSSSVTSATRPGRFSPARQRLLFALLTFSSLTSGGAALAAGSLPTGGHFVGGAGAITTKGNGLSVNQTTQTGIVNWQSFSIGKGNSVDINNGTGATLNRVTGGNISTIAGSLKATGSVYVVNSAGVMVTPTGKVVTMGSFVASTRDVSNASFMAGGAVDLHGNSAGTVVNQGSITSTNGDVVLVGKSVTNSGTINAAKGKAALAAGDDVLLQASGDDAVLVKAGSGDVTNTGTVAAAQAELNAAGGNVYALATNNGGIIRATGTTTKDGHVYLSAGDELVVNGSVTASNATGSGGAIVATGKAIDIGARAKISADGATNNGGTVLIGGKGHLGAQRSADAGLPATAIAAARTTDVAAGAQISANAGANGKGGNVVIWSNVSTNYTGNISAKGGTTSGNGGFVEVSGKDKLGFTGRVTTIAAHGATGILLLDPKDVTIYASTDTNIATFNNTSASSFLLNTTLDTMLASNNVTISTSGGSGGLGDIHFGTNGNAFTNAAPLFWTSNFSLTLNADKLIDTPGGNPNASTGGFNTFSPSTLINSRGSGSINFNAAGTGLTAAATDIALTGNIAANGGAINMISTGASFRIELGNGNSIVNTAANGAGKILLQADQVRLGTGTGPTGLVQTPGEVDIAPTSAGAVVIGDIDPNGQYSNNDNTTLIITEDIPNITANLLVVGSTTTTNLTLTTVNRAGESASLGFPTFDAVNVNNLKLLTGPNGSVTQDANTAIIVHDVDFIAGTNFLATGVGGLVVQTGGAITLNSPFNSVGTIAFMQTGAGGDISFTRQGDHAASSVGLIVGDVAGINGITTVGAGRTVTISINETTANPAASDPGSSISPVAVGGIAVTQSSGADAINTGHLDLEGAASSFTLNNTSNSVNRVSGTVSSLFLYDRTALTQTAGTTLTGTGTGTGLVNAAIQIVDHSNITLNTGSTIVDANGGDIQLETNTKFSSSLTDANTLNLTGGGVWRVYSQSPLSSGEQKGALIDNYIQYHALNSDSAPFSDATEAPLGTGNGFLYAFQPTVTATVTATRAYNGTTTGASGILLFGSPTGAVAGDTVTVTTGSSGTFNSKDVVSATTVSVAGTSINTATAKNPNNTTIQVYNYAVNPNATGAGTITPIPLTITAGNDSKTYGQVKNLGTSNFTTGAGQLISGESITSVMLSSAGTPAAANAGLYSIVGSSGTGSGGFLASNYNVNFVNGVLTVDKAALTLTPKAVSEAYDGSTLNNTTYSDNTGTYTYSGFQNGDTAGTAGLSLTGSMAFSGSIGTAVKNAGTYSQGVGTLALSSTNYTLTFTNPTPNNYVITPAALTLTPKAVSVVYNGSTLNNTTYSDTNSNYTFGGFQGTDTLGNSGIVLTGSMAFAGSTGTAVKNVATYSQGVGTLSLTSTNGNYTLSFANPTPNNYVITPAALSITADSTSKTYGQTTTFAGTEFTVGSGLVGVESVDSVSLTSPGAVATANAGSYSITGSAATGSSGFLASNYTITYHPGTLTVNKAALTLTPKAVSVVYDGSTLNNTTYSDNTGNYTFSGFQNGDTLGTSGITLGGSMAFAGSTGTAVKNVASYSQGAGTLTLTSANYALSFTNPTPNNYVITPAALTLTPKAVSVVYNGSTLNNTTYSDTNSNYTFGGFQGTDTLGNSGIVLTGSMAFAGSTGTAVKNVATYSQGVGTLSLTSTNGNYTLSFANPTPNNYVITPAALSITADSTSKTYGQTTTFAGTEFTVGSGLVGVESVDSVSLTSPGAVATANAGSYSITGSAATGSSGFLASNYTITYHPGTLTVNKAALTLTPKAVSVVYDGSTLNNTTYSDNTGNYTFSGFQNGDTLGTSGIVLTGSMAFAGSTGTAVKNVATYSQGAGTLTLSSTNYALSFTNPKPNNYVITPLAVTLADLQGTRVYDGTTNANASILTIVNLATGDTVTLTGNGTLAGKNVGKELITNLGTLALGGEDAGNYKLSAANPNDFVIVTKANLIVSAVTQTKVYDGTVTSTGTPTVVGLKTGDSIIGTLMQAYGSKNVLGPNGSTLSVTNYTGVNDGNSGGNYNVIVKTATGTITPFAVNLTGTRVYDGLKDGDSGILSVTNPFGSDNVIVVSGTSTIANKDVGPEGITNFGTLKLGGADVGNYTLVGATGTVTVTPLAIIATGTRVYDGTTGVDGSILTVTNAPTGDDIGLTGTGTSGSKHVGTHDVTDPGTLTLTGTDARNYTLTGGKETVKITPFAVVLTGTRVYDGLTDGDSGILSVTNAFAGDTVTVASGTSTIVSRNVGDEKITDFGTLTLGGGSSGDYTLVGAKGNVIVTPEMLTVTAVPGTKTYDGDTTSTGTPIVTTGTIFGPDTGGFIQTYGNPHAGTGITLTPSGMVNDGNGGNNYVVTYVPITTGVIDPRPVILTGTRVFDNQTDAGSPILSITNLIGTDMVTVTGTGVLKAPDLGPESIVDFNGLTLGGPSVGDYTLVGAIGVVTITPAPDTTPTINIPNTQTASGNGTVANFTAYDGGLITLAPRQNGVVTGTIATIDGTDYQPDSQLSCTLGTNGCIQNGVAPTTTGTQPQ